MAIGETTRLQSNSGILTAGIFDVDGVLLASPHERAWRGRPLGAPRSFDFAVLLLFIAVLVTVSTRA